MKKKIFSILFALVLVLTMSLVTAVPALAAGPAAVNLGTAGNFAILAKSGISTTGTTSIVGDIGVSPIAATGITGFALAMDASGEFSTSSLVTGKVYAADYAVPTPAYLTTAVSDMETAYTDAMGRTLPDFIELGAGDISGMTLAPGLYKWSTGLLIDNTGVTLEGGANDVWIFQIAGTLTVASDAIVNLSGGAQAENIFWAVADVNALGSASVFNGNILSQTNITMTDGATLNGRALAQTAVTLIGNTITAPGAAAVLENVQVTQGAVGEPTIASVTPDSGVQTRTYLDVAIAGTNLELASAVSFGDDIIVTNFNKVSDILVTVDIAIGTSAAAGPRNVSVTVATVPEETVTLVDGFTVIATYIKVTAPSNINLGTMARGAIANSGSIDGDAGTVVTNLQSWKVTAKDSAVTDAGFMKTTGGDPLSVALNVSLDGATYSTADVGLTYVDVATLPFYVEQGVAADEGSGSYSITLEFVGSLGF